MNWQSAFLTGILLIGLVMVLPIVTYMVVKFGATAFYAAKRRYDKMKQTENEKENK